MSNKNYVHYIELKEKCVSQMRIEVCDGCDACGLRCAAGVPATRQEWERVQQHIATAMPAEQAYIATVERQDKTFDLGDEVTVQMCRYRDMENGRCAVYPARPLVCRLLGHVEWMPCPIAKVPQPIPTPDALALMRSYATLERNTFEQWEEENGQG